MFFSFTASMIWLISKFKVESMNSNISPRALDPYP